MEKGYWCTHSFYVSNPIAMKTSNEDSVYKNVLYVGRNKEVFFFNKKEIFTQYSWVNTQTDDLSLQVIYQDRNATQGELSRECQENCDTYHIPENTMLWKYLVRGNYIMDHYKNQVHALNPVPTIITHGLSQYLVYSKFGEGEDGVGIGNANDEAKAGLPCVYFYDMLL